MLNTKSIFDSQNSDIKIRSSDGVVFDLHKVLLATNTGVFTKSIGQNLEDKQNLVIELEEAARVLSVCFGFVYPKRHPDLDEITDFELLADIASAVEKYEIYSAMHSCDVRLRSFIPLHPTEILVHSMDHGYPKLMEKASSYLSRTPLVETLKKLPSDYYVPWVQYHEAWRRAFRETIDHIEAMPNSPTACQCHKPIFGLKSNDHVICSICRSSMLLWVTSLERIDDLYELRLALKFEAKPTGNSPLPCCNPAFTFANSPKTLAVLPSQSKVVESPKQKQMHRCNCTHAENVANFLQDRIQALPPLDTFITSRRQLRQPIL